MEKEKSYFYNIIIYAYIIFMSIFSIVSGYFAIKINFHSLPWLIATVVNFSLAVFVYLKDKRNVLYITFAVTNIFIAVFAFDIFGLHIIKNYNLALRWSMILRIGILFIPAAFFHFAAILSNNKDKKRNLIYLSYLASLIFSILNFTPYFKNEMIKRELAYFPKFGKIYFIFIANFVLWTFLGLSYIYNKYKKSESYSEKNQLKYFFFATAITSIFGLLPQTLYGLGVKIYPIGGFACIFYSGIITYSIVKHQLMDITIAVRRGIIYTLLIIFLIGIYLAITVNFHSLPWLIATVINLLLAIFVYLKDRRNPLNITFAISSILIASWTFDVFGFHIIKDSVFVKHWSLIMRLGTIFIPSTLFHFMMILSKSISKRKNMIYISYMISILFSILNFTPYFENEMIKREWAYFPKFSGLLYKILIINFIFWVFLGLAYVYNRYKKSESSHEKNQLGYFFLATASAAILCILPQILYGIGVKIYPIGGLGNIFYTGIIAYAIVQHQLMDITIIVRRGILYTTLTFVVVGTYSLIVGSFTGLFSIFNIAEDHSILMLINGFAGLFIALIFLPIKNKIQNTVDKLFFKDRYDYIETLKNLSNDLTTIFDLDKLLRTLLTRLMDTMHIERGYVMVYDSEKDSYIVRFSKGMEHEKINKINFNKKDKLLHHLEKNKTILIIDDKENNFEELKSHKVNICIPLMIYDKLVGILNLGNKLSEDIYTSEDLRLLTTIANQAAIAIENAQLSMNMRVIEKNLMHSDKLAALGTLASSVTHEIKNPLASVKIFCQLVSLKYEDSKFRDKFNNIVPNEIERIENIVDQLLNFAKSSTLEYNKLNVNSIIDNLLDLIQYEAYKYNINISKQFEVDIPLIMADQEQLKQVFMNIILNAIQAMPNGGNLDIWTDSNVIKGTEYVSIIVKDTGVGISEEFMGKVFEPFNTTKPNGTGLGLTIVHRIIKDHNGKIEINSELNKGTTVAVYIPVIKSANNEDT